MKDEYELLIDRAIHNHADILLGETLSQAREARMIARIAQKTTIPLWISFTVDESGNLRSGESLKETATELLNLGVKALLVNCSTMQNIHKSMSIYQALAASSDFQYGAYGNRYNEIRKDYELKLKSTTLKEDLSPEMYTEAAKSWVEKGATIVGGCCGIGPEYIRHICQNL
jgi:S-methylmethionine-dependent homocysteine/selenocysteine methylase